MLNVGEAILLNKRYIYLLSVFIGSIITGDFKEIIKSVIKEIVTYNKDVSLEMLFDELDKNQLNIAGMDFGAMPKVNRDSVQVGSKYANNFTAENTKVTSSDPYKEIFGN